MCVFELTNSAWFSRFFIGKNAHDSDTGDTNSPVHHGIYLRQLASTGEDGDNQTDRYAEDQEELNCTPPSK